MEGNAQVVATALHIPLSGGPGDLEQLLTQEGCSLVGATLSASPLCKHRDGCTAEGQRQGTYSLQAAGALGGVIDDVQESSSLPGSAG